MDCSLFPPVWFSIHLLLEHTDKVLVGSRPPEKPPGPPCGYPVVISR